LMECYRSVEPNQTWWHLPDGQTLRVVTNPHPQGGVTYFYENVTEKLELEIRFNALLRVQGETLDHLSDAVAVFGSDGRLRLWNPAFTELWRLAESRAKQRPHVAEIIEWCSLLHDDKQVWSALSTSVTALDEHREPFSGRMERADGTVVDFGVEPLPDGATLATFVNVTDSVRMERALVDKNEALVAADRLKNAFIQHVSYELRSPLTNIIGFAELLSEPKIGDLNAKQGEYAQLIQSSSSALLAIINDILDLATVDAGIMELDLQEVEISETLAAAVEGVQDRLAEASIKLVTNIPAAAGAFIADGRRVRQILFNLLSNAIAYSNEGDPIELVCERTTDAVVFTVTDHGCGIPDEVMTNVFDRFVAHGAGHHRHGVGLGLSIVKSFVELHGGTVSISSSQRTGTTVICHFPARPLPIAAAAAE
jgi:signal transduction histidine kinase